MLLGFRPALFALAVTITLFTVTMLVYGLGLTIGACTWSTQLVTIVALNDIMVGAIIWKTLS
jgi:hypothetical protein